MGCLQTPRVPNGINVVTNVKNASGSSTWRLVLSYPLFFVMVMLLVFIVLGLSFFFRSWSFFRLHTTSQETP